MARKNRDQICELLVSTCPIPPSCSRPVSYSNLLHKARQFQTESPLLNFVLLNTKPLQLQACQRFVKETGHRLHQIQTASHPAYYRKIDKCHHPVLYPNTITLYSCFVRNSNYNIQKAENQYEQCVDHVFQWKRELRRAR